MTANHLDGDMGDMGATEFGGLDWRGMGFGLGFSVVLDPERVGYVQGHLRMVGAASTYFRIDPVADHRYLLYAIHAIPYLHDPQRLRPWFTRPWH